MTESEFKRLLRSFPGLVPGKYRVTSPVDYRYNCIAWAAGVSDKWWQPDGSNFWPIDTIGDYSVSNYIRAYESLGYAVCEDFELSVGVEKVAIFEKTTPVPHASHAARQLHSGWWASKLGQSIDIEHELRAVEGSVYGRAVVALQRQLMA